MSSSWPATVHISTVVVCTGSSKSRVCDALCIQTESHFVWIVLCYGQSSWYDLRLVSVSPAMLVFVWIICACRLQPLKVCEMERLLRVGDELAFLEFRHDVSNLLYGRKLEVLL